MAIWNAPPLNRWVRSAAISAATFAFRLSFFAAAVGSMKTMSPLAPLPPRADVTSSSAIETMGSPSIATTCHR